MSPSIDETGDPIVKKLSDLDPIQERERSDRLRELKFQLETIKTELRKPLPDAGTPIYDTLRREYDEKEQVDRFISDLTARNLTYGAFV